MEIQESSESDQEYVENIPKFLWRTGLFLCHFDTHDESMVFCFDHINRPDRSIQEIILKNGGFVADNYSDDDHAIILSTMKRSSQKHTAYKNRDLYDAKFISDSAKQTALMNLNLYLIGESAFSRYNANKVLLRRLKWSEVQEKNAKTNPTRILSRVHLDKQKENPETVDRRDLLEQEPVPNTPKNKISTPNSVTKSRIDTLDNTTKSNTCNSRSSPRINDKRVDRRKSDLLDKDILESVPNTPKNKITTPETKSRIDTQDQTPKSSATESNSRSSPRIQAKNTKEPIKENVGKRGDKRKSDLLEKDILDLECVPNTPKNKISTPNSVTKSRIDTLDKISKSSTIESNSRSSPRINDRRVDKRQTDLLEKDKLDSVPNTPKKISIPNYVTKTRIDTLDKTSKISTIESNSMSSPRIQAKNAKESIKERIGKQVDKRKSDLLEKDILESVPTKNKITNPNSVTKKRVDTLDKAPKSSTIESNSRSSPRSKERNAKESLKERFGKRSPKNLPPAHPAKAKTSLPSNKSPTPTTSGATSSSRQQSTPSPYHISSISSSENEGEVSPLKRRSSRKVAKVKPSGPKKFYSKGEQIKIIDFIVDNDFYKYTGGNKIWMYLEHLEIVPNRTHQSLKENFRKQIVTNLKSFDVPRHVLQEFDNAAKYLLTNKRKVEAPIDLDRMIITNW